MTVLEPAAPEELEEDFMECTYPLPVRVMAMVSDPRPTVEELPSGDHVQTIHMVYPSVQFDSAVSSIQMARVLAEFPTVCTDVFPEKGAQLPPMVLEMLDPALLPKSVPPRRQSPLVAEFVRTTVSQLLVLNFIRPSTAAFVSPIVVARSPNRAWRFCIDYTEVNKCTKRLPFPSPNTKDLLARMAPFNVFAKLDLKKGFHQISLDPASRHFSAFVCSEGIFEWNVIPFGFLNGPAHFQWALSTLVLPELIGQCCYVYIDDIIIGGTNDVDLIANVTNVLTRLRDVGLILNMSKCAIGLTTIEYLGQLLSSSGVTVPDGRRQGFRQLVPPITVKQLRSFLGLVNYFRDYIPQFSTISAPLYELTRKNVVFVWMDVHQEAFELLRKAVIEAPLLYHVDYNLPLILRTDASQYAVGGILVQPVDGVERLICCLSKTLSGTACRWSTRDQEAYAIYYCIMVLSCHLLGHPFIVETDHRNLTFIMKASEGRVYRWKIALQPYDYTVNHVAGIDNPVADGLSRCVPSMFDGVHSPASNAVAVVRPLPALESIEPEHVKSLDSVHNDLTGHPGISATIKQLRSVGNKWPTMRQDVVTYIQRCVICQKMRVTDHSSVAHGANQVIEAYEPFQECSLDTLSCPEDEDGYCYMLVMICNHTRYVELAASADKSATSWASFLLRVACRYGAPQILHSDQGGEFVNEIIAQMTSLFRCTQRFTIGYRPQANGVVERLNRELIRHLTEIIYADRIRLRWSSGVPLLMRIVNAHDAVSVGFAPSEIVYGGACNLDRGLMQPLSPKAEELTLNQYMAHLYDYQVNAILASQRSLAIVMDKRVAAPTDDPVEFAVGSYVVVSYASVAPKEKFESPWRGPYLVLSVFHNTYTLQDLRTQKSLEIDASRIKLFHVPPGVDPVAIAALDLNEDIVVSVLDHKSVGRGKKGYTFQVKFSDNTEVWLPYLEIRNVEALDTYCKDKPVLQKLFGVKP